MTDRTAGSARAPSERQTAPSFLPGAEAGALGGRDRALLARIQASGRSTRVRLLGAALGLFLCPAMPARSQPLPVPGWKLGVGPRYAWVTNLDSDRSNHEVGVGLRLRPLFVGLEAALDYHNEDLEDGVDLKSWPLSVSALVYPLGRYYALAGIVWAHTTVDFPHTLPFNDRTKTEHGYQLGVGVELPMPVVSVAADARWQFLDYEIDDIPETVGKIDADSFRITLSAFF